MAPKLSVSKDSEGVIECSANRGRPAKQWVGRGGEQRICTRWHVCSLRRNVFFFFFFSRLLLAPEICFLKVVVQPVMAVSPVFSVFGVVITELTCICKFTNTKKKTSHVILCTLSVLFLVASTSFKATNGLHSGFHRRT